MAVVISEVDSGECLNRVRGKRVELAVRCFLQPRCAIGAPDKVIEEVGKADVAFKCDEAKLWWRLGDRPGEHVDDLILSVGNELLLYWQRSGGLVAEDQRPVVASTGVASLEASTTFWFGLVYMWISTLRPEISR